MRCPALTLNPPLSGEHLDIKQLFPKDKVQFSLFNVQYPILTRLWRYQDAVVEFKGDFAGKEVVPYAMCNLHGIWRGSALAA